MTYKKKLIEVALPLDAIDRQCAREKEPFTRNHPRSMHVWWSRKPVAAGLAVVFAQLMDDPSAHPEVFPTPESQDAERQRLFGIIERLANWDNARDRKLFEEARSALGRQNDSIMVDPFAGGGTIPLAAHKLGLPAIAADINPVATLLNTLQIDWPSRFAGQAPVSTAEKLNLHQGLEGLAHDVSSYGRRAVKKVQEDLGHLFPDATDTKGRARRPIAWIGCRSMTCPNPACQAVIPLVAHWWLRRKKGSKTWLRPLPDALKFEDSARDIAEIVMSDSEEPPSGTVNRSGAMCLVCDTSVSLAQVRQAGTEGRLGRRLLAIAVDALSGKGKDYLPASAAGASPSPTQEQLEDVPATPLPSKALGFSVQNYGFSEHRDLFTPRQAVCLTALMDQVQALHSTITSDAQSSMPEITRDDSRPAVDGGQGPHAYADTVCAMLATAISRWAAFGNSLASWNSTNENVAALFAMQVLSMTWNYAEVNPFHGSPSVIPRIDAATKWMQGAITGPPGHSIAVPAQSINLPDSVIVCTDPPYFDNIGYGYLADFFYVWLRRALLDVHPHLFATILTPKHEELLPPSIDSTEGRIAFEKNLRTTFERLRGSHSANVPMTVFYAYKQDEVTTEGGRTSTGWEMMLEALVESGWQLTATWPIRTERMSRARSQGSNALASSVVLVCRPRNSSAELLDRREFVRQVRTAIDDAIATFKSTSIPAVDIAQAAIGPGMAVYSRLGGVMEADGQRMPVRTALEIINRALDESLGGVEVDLDLESRFALALFEQQGFQAGPYGKAEDLARAKNTAVGAAVAAGFLESRAGTVRLLRRSELPPNWHPDSDRRLSVWEATHHLVRRLSDEGEASARQLCAALGQTAEVCRDLAYRLYAVAGDMGLNDEAAAYNSLIASWSALLGSESEIGDGAHQSSMDI